MRSPFPTRWFLSCLAVLLSGCPDSEPPTRPSDPAPEITSPSTPRASNPSFVRDPGPAFEQFGMPGIQGLIVGAGEAGPFYAALTGGTSPDYWTPEKAHLIELETRLPAFLRAKAPPASRLRKEPKAFRRQYLGIKKDDRQLVFVHFFCETHRRDWTRKPITTDGQEGCFFQLHYEPAKREFSDLVDVKGS